MAEVSQEQSASRERTMLVAMLLSAPGPIATGIPAFVSLSATQIADFLRRTAELVALVVAWWVYRRLRRGEAPGDGGRARIESAANTTVNWTIGLPSMPARTATRIATWMPGWSLT